ncbi:MAG: FecR family protein, partial [Thermoanaerobaculia bacterium]|nr:FecR family protein [Thermoanaerobaculia bacterium]
MNTRRIWIQFALAAALVSGAAPAAAEQDGDVRESYSYLRTLDGTVMVAAPGNGPGEPAEANQPLLVGDEVRLDRGARAELLLADRSVLRLEGGSALTLEQVAFSADRQDRSTALGLTEGELVLVVTDDALGDQLPEVRTAAGTIFLNAPGTYRVEATRDGWTELVVREGYAEMVTDQGSTIVRGGESASTEGGARGRVRVATAGPEDGLERWGRDLHERAAIASSSVSYVEPELAYAAAPLADHGSWIYIDSSWSWRPRVEVGWRPYWRGRWSPTPSGLTWISSEPWGWVPYHYGTWVVAPGYGWVWRPGRVYSPAWVYWTWGADWTGWCPIGYYTGFYDPWYRRGFRGGIYGWAGGGWGFYSDWNFVPTWCVNRRDWHHHRRTGHELGRGGHGQSPHGIITTDTRG